MQSNNKFYCYDCYSHLNFNENIIMENYYREVSRDWIDSDEARVPYSP